MVISIVTANFLVKKVLIGQGRLANLLYLLTLRRMEIPKEGLKPFPGNLVNFLGEQVGVKGYIDLRIRSSRCHLLRLESLLPTRRKLGIVTMITSGPKTLNPTKMMRETGGSQAADTSNQALHHMGTWPRWTHEASSLTSVPSPQRDFILWVWVPS